MRSSTELIVCKLNLLGGNQFSRKFRGGGRTCTYILQFWILMLVSHASWGWLSIQVGIAFLFSYSPKVAQEGFEPPFWHQLPACTLHYRPKICTSRSSSYYPFGQRRDLNPQSQHYHCCALPLGYVCMLSLLGADCFFISPIRR